MAVVRFVVVLDVVVVVVVVLLPWLCCPGCGVQVVGVVIACRWMSLCVATVVVSPATIYLYIYNIYPYSLYSILIQTDILYTL